MGEWWEAGQATLSRSCHEEDLKKAKLLINNEQRVREHPTPLLPPYLLSNFLAVSSSVSRLYLTGAFLPPPNFTAIITPPSSPSTH